MLKMGVFMNPDSIEGAQALYKRDDTNNGNIEGPEGSEMIL